ncbi:MAG: DMT family transporter [Proteobacteria bacterium]|nr:DMT family transporter [Pseudomonadota bacterium]
MFPTIQNAALRGILWMVLCTGFQACASGLVRKLSFEFGIFELLLFFSTISAMGLIPMAMKLPRGSLVAARPHLGLFAARGVLSFIGMLTSFYAYSVLDIANVQSLLFTVPIFTILLASWILGEYVGLRGWISCAIGFAGALIIIRPGFVALNPGALAALISALAFAAANIVIRKLGATQSPVLITLASNAIIIPLAAIPAAYSWVTPDWHHAPWILAMGTLFMLAQLCLTYSIREADARIVQSFNFLRLPWAALIGWIMFAELPDKWTWIGAVVIFAGAYDVLRREAGLRRK